jgi:serine/threonine protein kinase
MKKIFLSRWTGKFASTNMEGEPGQAPNDQTITETNHQDSKTPESQGFEGESLINKLKYHLDGLDWPHVLGRNSFAEIYRARVRSTGRLLAVKKLDLRLLDDPEVICEETFSRAKIRHANIIELYELFWDGFRFVYLTLEYAPFGTLREFVTEFHPLSENLVKEMLIGLVDALMYCHKYEFRHRFITPDNLLVGAKRKLKLNDFHLSYKNDPYRGNETELDYTYVPPCVIGHKIRQHDETIETYTFGLISYFCLAQKHPFSQTSKPDLAECRRKMSFRCYEFPRDRSMSRKGKYFIHELLNPVFRPTWKEIKRSKWLIVDG